MTYNNRLGPSLCDYVIPILGCCSYGLVAMLASLRVFKPAEANLQLWQALQLCCADGSLLVQSHLPGLDWVQRALSSFWPGSCLCSYVPFPNFLAVLFLVHGGPSWACAPFSQPIFIFVYCSIGLFLGFACVCLHSFLLHLGFAHLSCVIACPSLRWGDALGLPLRALHRPLLWKCSRHPSCLLN